MNTNKIAETVKENFRGTITGNLVEVIEAMAAAKTMGYTLQDKLQAQYKDLTDGCYSEIKKAIAEQRKLDNYTSRSRSDARADAILTIRDSSGKAVARKW